MAATERTMTVDLRKDFVDTPTYKRAKKAVTSLRAHIMQHMKAKEVRIGKYLNMKLWERGIRNPAHKVTFIAKKDDKGIVSAELVNAPVEKQKTDKKAAKAKAKTEKNAPEAKKTAPAKSEKAASPTPAPVASDPKTAVKKE